VCDRYAFYINEATPGRDRFPGLERFKPNYNAVTGDLMPIVRFQGGELVVAAARWGYRVRGSNDRAGRRLATAHVKRIGSSNTFGESYRCMRRCLVPASGFFAWDLRHGRFQAYYCTSADGDLLTIAGVFEDGRMPDEALTYAIVVTDAGAGGHRGNPTTPLIVQPERHEAWLQHADPADVFDCSARPPLMFLRVSTRVAHVVNKDESLIEPVRRGRPTSALGARLR
jgi:putative SOS response-associated peptidase YedK